MVSLIFIGAGFLLVILYSIYKWRIIKDLYTYHPKVYRKYSHEGKLATAISFFNPGLRRLNLHLWFTDAFFLSKKLKRKIIIYRIISVIFIVLIILFGILEVLGKL